MLRPCQHVQALNSHRWLRCGSQRLSAPSCQVGLPADLKTLIDISDSGKYAYPCDNCTDCHDLLDLITGVKGVPTDKSQRLAVLALREDRLTGRTRNWLHIPTDSMLPDGLTKVKPGGFSVLMRFVTTGEWLLHDGIDRDHPVKLRRMQRRTQYEESDLLDIIKYDPVENPQLEEQMHVHDTSYFSGLTSTGDLVVD